jgi:hypothetical protein
MEAAQAEISRRGVRQVRRPGSIGIGRRNHEAATDTPGCGADRLKIKPEWWWRLFAMTTQISFSFQIDVARKQVLQSEI